MNRLSKLLFSSSLPILLSLCPALAETLTVPKFFSDHMVLQRNASAAIWGSASPGSEVTVTFKGSKANAKASEDGSWEVKVDTGVADKNGSDLVISSGDAKVVIQDVVVGEVWLACGQSNMVWTMERVAGYASEISEADYPGIRFFLVPSVTAVEPQDDIAGEWSLCNSDSLGGYSAVAYFFAKKLHQELGVPIGIIKTA